MQVRLGAVKLLLAMAHVRQGDANLFSAKVARAMGHAKLCAMTVRVVTFYASSEKVKRNLKVVSFQVMALNWILTFALKKKKKFLIK